MSSDQVIKPSMVVFAFDSLVNRLNGQPSPPIPADFPSQPFPLFVTWKLGPKSRVFGWKTSSNGYLRGCIGCFADLELGSGIEEYALTAALKDSRFPPVQMNEVPGLSCTVSLLTNFEECSNSYDWTLENHGIKIRFNA
ncbi:Oidioi.mRNA.OKI2018_I69.chr1.g3310.t1.cds [Oikopleura dioica]|uniref:Oidioi.mRNA.OKI2018_I69.chr1.g3310.t1.cds n=1 Tax=Oikopleura dioica TaxID=34765 RepID=A0ABN7SVG6_OIKDI|nr:Oidioi.mRNA.OKI2018_I69.chr1.g3310.t1.cds [Oikopleura dioica]